MVKIQKRVKRIIATLLAAFLVITQVPASMNRVEAADKEYPEYYTGQQMGSFGKNHETDFCDECQTQMHIGYYGPRNQHYVRIGESNDENAVTYVRCDVWMDLNNKPNPEYETYLVTYEHENGDFISKEPVNKYASPQSVPTNLGNGYWTFKGEDNEIDPATKKIIGPTTFVWHEVVEEKVSIEYKTDNADMGNVTNQKETVLIGEISGSTAEAKKGYKFDGWYKENTKISEDSVLTSEVVKDNLNKENDKYKDTVFTAKFEKDFSKWYEVTYKATTGVTFVNTEMESIQQYKDILVDTPWEKVSAPELKVQDGYYFDGWYEDGFKIEKFPETVTENHYYTAKVIKQTELDKINFEVSELSNETYDGKEHKKSVTVTDKNTNRVLVENVDYVLEYRDGQGNIKTNFKDKGIVKVCITGIGSYYGYIETSYLINPREVEITSKNLEKSWDGTPLEGKGADDVIVDGFVDGEGVAEYKFTGSQTEIGVSDNKFEILTFKEGTNEDNYKITLKYGNLDVYGQIIYDLNGGKGTAVDNNKYHFDEKATLNSGDDIYKDNAIFLGWSRQKHNDLTNPDDLDQVTLDSEWTMKKKSITFYAVWSKDIKGTDPENPDKSDEIPDVYQLKVTLEAHNGTFSDGKKLVERYVTLLDKNNKPSKNGTGYLTEEQIPVVGDEYADKGYLVNDIIHAVDPQRPETQGKRAIWRCKEEMGITPPLEHPITRTKHHNFYFEYVKDMESKYYILEYNILDGNEVIKRTSDYVLGDYWINEEPVFILDFMGTYKFAPLNTGKLSGILGGYDLTGYAFDYAKVNGKDFDYRNDVYEGMEIPSGTIYKYYYTKQDYLLTINYVDENGNELEESHTEKVTYGEEFSVVSPNVENYALVKPEQAIVTGKMDANGETIDVVYSKDVKGTDPENPDKGDQIPDKYQVKVQFEANNGTLNITTPQYVTLYAEDGKTYDENGVGHLTEAQIAKATAIAGYDQETLVWTPKAPATDIEISEDMTFVATFEKASYDLTINYVDEDGNSLANVHESQVLFDEDYSVESPTIDGYTLVDPDQATIEGTMGASDITIDVVYATDTKGTDPENPDKGDNIPDKYQVEVKFEAVNGTVSLDRTYVTLVDEEGNYAENGKGFLTEAQIVKATANTGYDQETLVWTPEAPTTDIEISEAMTFVATFEEVEEPVVPVDPTDPPVDPTDPEVPVTPEDPDITVTPDPETPAQPTNPEVTTPTDDTPQVVNPVDDTPAQVEDEPVVDVVEDEDTPLANLPEENVDDNQTPLAGLNGGWALVNLICTVVTVLFGLFLLISKKKKEEDKEDDEKQMNVNVDEYEEEIRKRGLFTRILSVVVAIASVIVFFLTEDLTLKMVMTDKWTLLMVVFALVQVVIFFVGRKWKAPKGNKPQQQTAMQ